MARIIKGINDLETLFPALMEEWDYNRNEIEPSQISVGSKYKAFWICKECGHRWSAVVYSRTHNIGCPECGKKKAKEKSMKTLLQTKGSLSKNYPELMKEWDYVNNTIDPNEITSNNNRKVFWICSKCGGNWESTVASRTAGHGCPYCSNNAVLKGVSDFKTLYPELALEWDYKNNIGLNPDEIAPNSMRSVYWRCSECGFRWKASLNNRTHKKSGCPKCAKNYHVSFPEKAIFYYISKVFTDTVENANIEGLMNFELDIFIPSINIAIEYDGEAWHKKLERDIIKDKLCAENDIQLIRVREPDCPTIENSTSIIYKLKTEKRNELNIVIKRILDYLAPNNNVVVDINSDNNDIYECMKVPHIYNSLEKMHPELVKEWHPNKNGSLLPKDFKSGSNKKVWWKCSVCGYEWETAISARTRKGVRSGSNCPCCSGRIVVQGINDLMTKRPDIAAEWNYEKNQGLTTPGGIDISVPENVSSGSSQTVWWHCNKCNYEWQARISNRTHNNSICPNCRNSKKALE